jgi:hypothetical protein
MQLKMQEAAGVLYAEVRGELDLQMAMGLYLQLVERWRAIATAAIVIDCRGLTGTLSDMQRYEVGVAVAASYSGMRDDGRAPRIAMIAQPPLIEPRRFIETVASNRGALLRAFESIREAAEWLDVDAALLPVDLSESILTEGPG